MFFLLYTIWRDYMWWMNAEFYQMLFCIYWDDHVVFVFCWYGVAHWFIYPPAVDFPFGSLTRHLKFSSTYTKLNSWSSHNQIYSFDRFPHAVVQSLSHVWHIVIPWIAARQISLSFTISQSLLKLMSLESGMPSNHCIFCCTILLLPSVLPSITVFSYELALHIMWQKYWSFSFSTSPSYEYSGMISFCIHWFDLLDVQGILKSLLQHQSLKTAILQRSVSFIV